MKKHIRKIIIAVILLAISGGIYYIHLLTPIITGYAAKNLASGIFVANRTQESMETIDLNFSFIKFTKNTVDFRLEKRKAFAISEIGYAEVSLTDLAVQRINRPNTPNQLIKNIFVLEIRDGRF